jgi:hypothetical protein
MFKLTQRYLESRRIPKSDSFSGNKFLVFLCVRYQRVRWWWVWHKEQPGVVSAKRAVFNMLRVLFSKGGQCL